MRILAGFLCFLIAILCVDLACLLKNYHSWRERALKAEELLWYYDSTAMLNLYQIPFEEWKRKWGLR